MYGMVNRAARAMVLAAHGEAAWASIRARAGIEEDDFEPLRSYPDAITYQIVAAAAEELGASAEQVLEAFGEYWIEYAISCGYGSLLRPQGTTLFEYLQELDNMHTRLSLSFEGYQPPSFYCTDTTENRTTLHYISDREGLGPFVVGLVRGLGKLFGIAVTITPVASRAAGADHDEFSVAI